jgi:hypothetical protein
MMIKLVRSPVSAEIAAAAQQNDHERVAEPTEEVEWKRETSPLLQRIGAVAEPALGHLGRAEAISANSELLLEVGESGLPEFPLGPATRRHRKSFWSF